MNSHIQCVCRINVTGICLRWWVHSHFWKPLNETFHAEQVPDGHRRHSDNMSMNRPRHSMQNQCPDGHRRHSDNMSMNRPRQTLQNRCPSSQQKTVSYALKHKTGLCKFEPPHEHAGRKSDEIENFVREHICSFPLVEAQNSVKHLVCNFFPGNYFPSLSGTVFWPTVYSWCSDHGWSPSCTYSHRVAKQRFDACGNSGGKMALGSWDYSIKHSAQLISDYNGSPADPTPQPQRRLVPKLQRPRITGEVW